MKYKEPATTEEVYVKNQQAVELHQHLLTVVKRCKLQWYGHISRTSGLANNNYCSDKGKKARRTKQEVERQHQGMDRSIVGKFQRAVENKANWRQLVAKPSVVPQGP